MNKIMSDKRDKNYGSKLNSTNASRGAIMKCLSIPEGLYQQKLWNFSYYQSEYVVNYATDRIQNIDLPDVLKSGVRCGRF